MQELLGSALRLEIAAFPCFQLISLRDKGRGRSPSFKNSMSTVVQKLSAAEAGGLLSEDRKALKKKAVGGTIWVAVGFGAGQVIRLGSNLVLTRLLAPELFGLMALVNAFMTGLAMFSDVGLAPSLIQSERGEDKDFLNTGWTIQAIRGFVIAIVGCLVAPLLADFYHEPDLTPLIMAASIGPLFSGFWSTRMITEKRDLRMQRLTILQFASQLCAVIVSISWALISPSVWALVGGGITAVIVNLVGGHLYLPRRKHSFTWHKESVQELSRFGRWIFLATVCGFLVNHADRFIVGKLFTMEELGVYSIALLMLNAGKQLFNQFKQSILLPVYSSVKRQDPERFASMVRKARVTLLKFVVPALVSLTVGGDLIVDLLFDPRYADAGPLLQLLSAGLLVEMCQESGPVLLSHGDSFLMTKVTVSRALLQLAGMIVGGVYWGQAGLVVGILCARLLTYPLTIIQNRKYGVWFWKLDLVALLGSAGLIVALLQLRKHLFA